jgi:hypothetical protein
VGIFTQNLKKQFSHLKNDGEYSKPFKTPNGWHIVKRLSYEPIGDLKSLRYNLKNKIQKDSRAQKTKSSFINKLKTEYIQYNKFIDQKLIAFEKTQLERKHPEFKALMKEYRDGILLFEISDQKIWSKAIQDTSGLKKHFAENRILVGIP